MSQSFTKLLLFMSIAVHCMSVSSYQGEVFVTKPESKKNVLLGIICMAPAALYAHYSREDFELKLPLALLLGGIGYILWNCIAQHDNQPSESHVATHSHESHEFIEKPYVHTIKHNGTWDKVNKEGEFKDDSTQSFLKRMEEHFVDTMNPF